KKLRSTGFEIKDKIEALLKDDYKSGTITGKKDGISSLFEKVTKYYKQFTSRGTTNNIDNYYVQMGARDRRFDNEASDYKPRTGLEPDELKEAENIQKSFCLTLQDFMKRFLEHLGSNDLKFLLWQCPAHDKRVTQHHERGATQLDRALNHFTCMLSLEHYS
ncbi:hypothetical protein TrRE_jg12261, partial [Triparma retinervis]